MKERDKREMGEEGDWGWGGGGGGVRNIGDWEGESRLTHIKYQNGVIAVVANNILMTYLTYSLFASWSSDRDASAISTICFLSDFH